MKNTVHEICIYMYADLGFLISTILLGGYNLFYMYFINVSYKLCIFYK